MKGTRGIGRVALGMILEPRTTLKSLAESPRIVDLFVALVVLQALGAFLVVSITERSVRSLLAHGTPLAVRARAEEEFARVRRERVLAAPLGVAAVAVGTAFALAIAGRVSGRSPPWNGCFAMGLAVSIPQLVERIIDLEMLWRDGPELTLELRPIFAPTTSLASFISFDERGAALRAGAEALSPFTIWSSALAALGARELRAPRVAALAAGILAWGARFALAALNLRP